MTNRSHHLQWCKDRANAYLDQGNITDGITSMLSDLDKHEGTKLPQGSPLIMLGMMALMNCNLADARRFVEGFN